MTNQCPDVPPSSLEQSDLVLTLLPEAIVLLENDFLTSGMELKMEGIIYTDVFELRKFLAGEVLKTGGPGAEQFYRLLYRADIPESKVRQLLKEEANEPFEIRIAELLIIRALQKAFFRKKYKK